MTLIIETGFDLEAIGALSFTLVENGSAVGVVQMVAGTHFLTLDGTSVTRPDGETSFALGYTPFTTALKAALEAVGAGTYTVDFGIGLAPGDGLFGIGVSGGAATFRLQGFNTVALRVLGMTVAQADDTKQVSNVRPWYRLQTNLGILTDYFWDEEEDGDLGEEVIAHDGTDSAIAEDELPVLFEATIPHEPRQAVWNEFAPASAPWTWQRLFRHARNVQPHCLDFADGGIARKFFVRFRRDGRRFAPKPRPTPVGKNWWEAADIELRARLLGKT